MKRITTMILFSAFLWGCVELPTDISIPIWDTELRLPITQQEYRIGDIVNLDDEVAIDSTISPYIYSITTEDYNRQIEIGDYADGLIDAQYAIEDVPVGTLDTSAIFDLPDGNLIYEATVKEGNLRITYLNASQNDMDVTITIPALTNSSGAFSINGTAPAGGNLDEQRSIAGYTYKPDPNIGLDKMQILLDADGNVSTESSDLNIILTNTSFVYVDGQLASRNLGDVNEQIDLDIPDDTKELRNKVTFHDARMLLDVNYISGNTNVFSAELFDPVIVGTFGSQSINLTLKDGSPIDNIRLINGNYYIVYDTDNSNISDFLSFMPELVFVRGEILLNPTEQRGEISDTDILDIKISLEINSIMSINQADFTELEEINFDSDDRENLEQAKKVVLYYELENEVPIITSVDLEFLNNSPSFLFSKSIVLDAGESNFPNAITMKTYRDSIIIDESEMAFFRDSYFVRMKVSLSTPVGFENPYFSPDQTIAIKTWADITVEVDLDESEEEAQ